MAFIQNSSLSKLPEDSIEWPNLHAAHLQLLEERLQAASVYPRGRYAGRGIVVCVNTSFSDPEAGPNQGYLPGAWVLVNELRHWGCNLPVTFAYIGDAEWHEPLTQWVADLGVECLDLLARQRVSPMRTLRGWESKVYAIQESRYEEVLFLDADNIPLMDPSFLFEAPKYTRCGALFWPDVPPGGEFQTWLPEAAWSSIGIPPPSGVRACESGQLLIHKGKCWRQIDLARWINEHSDWFYGFVYGDKDTYILAWNKIARQGPEPWSASYHMVERSPINTGSSLIHFDPDGLRPLFQHCTKNKATIEGYLCPSDLVHASRCLRHLARLKASWSDLLAGGRGT